MRHERQALPRRFAAAAYVRTGALARDDGFGLTWMMLSTLLIWAAPAQAIPVSARFLPMAVALLPLLRAPRAAA